MIFETDGRQISANMGRKFSLPPDVYVAEAVRKGIRAHPDNIQLGAKVAGLDKHVFATISRLIKSLDGVLAPDDRELVTRALELIELDRSLIRARKLINTLQEKGLIKPGKIGGRRFKFDSQNRRFDKTIVAILEACESSYDMPLPRNITRLEASKAIAALATSIALIGNLQKRLLGEKQEPLQDEDPSTDYQIKDNYDE